MFLFGELTRKVVAVVKMLAISVIRSLAVAKKINYYSNINSIWQISDEAGDCSLIFTALHLIKSHGWRYYS